MEASEVGEVERVIAAPPSRVWRAQEPARLIGWLCEEASGALAVGGQLTLGWPSLGLEAELEVAELEPGRRLLLRGIGDAADQWQETALEPVGERTRVRVRHGFPPGERGRERAAGSAAGWQVALRLLELYLGGLEGRRMSAIAAVGTAGGEVAALWPSLSRPDRLAGWLGAVAGGLAEGDHLTLTIGARAFDADVLCRAAPHELCLALPAIGGVLRLRLIELQPGGPTLVCAQLIGWSGVAPLAALEPDLVSAVDRLLGPSGGARA